MRQFKFLAFLLSILIFTACSNSNEISENNDDTAEETEEGNNQDKPNILLIIADDMGLDATPGYNFGTTKPNMPTLQSMINSGITFNNLWSYPVCTPTRASILTGKYGFRTNVQKVDDELSTSEISIQKHLDINNSGYNHAVIGKWHLSKDQNHPNTMGVSYYAGLLTGGVHSYWNWNLTENGAVNSTSEYTTTKFTDLAIDWIEDQTQPWFLWLAYNAPHTPFHLPPNELHYQGQLPTDEASISANPRPYYLAAIEAMDTEMGRLLSSMTQEQKDNTVVIFIGDNGTPNQVVEEYPSRRTKGSVYQGGVNVPMIISGTGISRINQSEDALINTTDLYATVADIASVGTTEIYDSKSFKELFEFENSNSNFRNYAYTEVGNDLGTYDYTIRNATHKYIRFSDNSEALYNLIDSPLETVNLMSPNQLPLSDEDTRMKDELIAEANRLRE